MKRRTRLGQVKLSRRETHKILDATLNRCTGVLDTAEATEDRDLRILFASNANGCFAAVGDTVKGLLKVGREKRTKLTPGEQTQLRWLLEDIEKGETESRALALEKRAPLFLEEKPVKKKKKKRKTS